MSSPFNRAYGGFLRVVRKGFAALDSDMLLNSFILLLLSNAITSIRDKYILYSIATITILLISVFIAYLW